MAADGTVRDVGFEELESGMADGSLVVVDVREDQELASGVIPGSRFMPLSRFAPGDLPAGKRVVFSCAAGVRSRSAIELCRRAGLGFDEHFSPGFRGWAMSGRRIEPGPS